MAYPKWVTPNRQTYLVKLWLQHGNKCLHGHSVCPIPSHYVYAQPKGVKIAVPVKVPCRDSVGNPLIVDGKQVFLAVYGVKTTTVYEQKIARLYELKSEQAIRAWVADDKAQALAEWQAEQKRLHSLAERRYPIRGQFSSIAKDIYFANQPLYYLLGYGISGLTFKPFAKVRLASSFVNLYVDLGDSLKAISKNKRRKAIRYGNALPYEKQREVEQVCRLAVKHYLHN